MIGIEFKANDLTPDEQRVVTEGFARHSTERSAPDFNKRRVSWVAVDSNQRVVGALTADLLWDWIYIDELWVDEESRGTGLGKKLMQQAEEYAVSNNLRGLWLWTQSWQAADFYTQLGYEEFARFEDFPKGHSRIGFRKQLAR